MFALVFHKNARQFMSTLELFSALLSSHVFYVALLFFPPPRRGISLWVLTMEAEEMRPPALFTAPAH